MSPQFVASILTAAVVSLVPLAAHAQFAAHGGVSVSGSAQVNIPPPPTVRVNIPPPPTVHVVAPPPPRVHVAAVARPAVHATAYVAPPAASASVVVVAPPPPRVEVRPPAPSATVVWVPGFWAWRRGHHVWVRGTYRAPPARGQVWVAPRWQHRGRAYVMVPGRWRGGAHVAARVRAPSVHVRPPSVRARVVAHHGGHVRGHGHAGVRVHASAGRGHRRR